MAQWLEQRENQGSKHVIAFKTMGKFVYCTYFLAHSDLRVRSTWILDIDRGGYIFTNDFLAVITEWLKAS